MKQLHVLYDGRCAMCTTAVHYLRHKPAYISMVFLSSQSPQARAQFPTLLSGSEPKEVIAISDDGGVYRDDSAWLICLWALREYRYWSCVLSQPTYRPIVRRIIALLGEHRLTISRILWAKNEHERGVAEPPTMCADNTCIRSLKHVHLVGSETPLKVQST